MLSTLKGNHASSQQPPVPRLAHPVPSLVLGWGKPCSPTPQKISLGFLPQTDHTTVPACDSHSLFSLLMEGDRYNQGSYPSPVTEACLVPPVGMSLLLVVLERHRFMVQPGTHQSLGDEVPGSFSPPVPTAAHPSEQSFLPNIETRENY